jgi:hypothetical protein
MRESANFCENRLLCYRAAVNAALGTTLSFPPKSRSVLAKTGRLYSEAAQLKVKTENG